MADNYIERQFEQYQAKKAAWQKPLKHTSKKTNSKRVFITGGANGIGKAIVKAFRQKNYPVAFCDKDETSGLQTAKETGAAFYLVDIQNKEALENCMLKIIKRWGDIDILINNAGVSLFSDLTETSVEDFDQILSINLRPVFITSRLLAIHRKAQDSPQHYGRIINICSTRHLMSEPGSEGYAASKGGIYSLTHALALSLAKQHITVNSISPGWIQTQEYELIRIRCLFCIFRLTGTICLSLLICPVRLFLLRTFFLCFPLRFLFLFCRSFFFVRDTLSLGCKRFVHNRKK